MSNDFSSKRIEKYMQVHKYNPPYCYERYTLYTVFLFDKSPIFTLFGLNEDAAEQITLSLNQAYLEGWLNRQTEIEYENSIYP